MFPTTVLSCSSLYILKLSAHDICPKPQSHADTS